MAQTFRPSETNNICFFKWAGYFILVFAWSECLSYLTVFTVISCRYFRNYVVFIRHVLSLSCGLQSWRKQVSNLHVFWFLYLLDSPNARTPSLHHHFFRNACTVSGSLRFSVFRLLTDFVCLYTNMSFDFPFVRLFGVR